MQKNSTHLIETDSVFGWLAAVTGLVLSLPYLAMRYDWRVPEPGNYISDRVVWSMSDFVVMGTLIYGMGSIFIILARKVDKKNRLAVGIATFLVFLYIWAELAVGVFTTIGS